MHTVTCCTTPTLICCHVSYSVPHDPLVAARDVWMVSISCSLFRCASSINDQEWLLIRHNCISHRTRQRPSLYATPQGHPSCSVLTFDTCVAPPAHHEPDLSHAQIVRTCVLDLFIRTQHLLKMFLQLHQALF